jgi:GWxTD domain-containing protein
MKKHNILLIPAATLLIVLLYACFAANKISVQNIADIYHGDYHYLHPQFRIYQVNDSSALLCYKIDESELLYVRKNQEDSFYSSARIICKVTSSYESAQISDSNSIILKISSATNSKKAYAIGSLPLKLKFNQNYLITVNTTDMTSKKEDVSYVNAESTDGLSSRNFLPVNTSDGQPLFPNYIDSEATIAVTYNKPVQKVMVNYYRRDFPLAAPPFSSIDPKPFKFKSDSSFTVTIGANNMFQFNAGPKGIYHVQADTTNRNGLTIYRVDKYYPGVALAGQLVPPLRYITSNEEYDRLTGAKNVKQAVDDFWLNLAGNNKERAKSLIRIYYNRVQDANKYFTSYLEGWKTDRGMIYIIYGPPNVVYRNTGSESWTYGEDRNFMSMQFIFQKTNNPFTDNDYTLDRSPQSRSAWYNAVDMWREGRVY